MMKEDKDDLNLNRSIDKVLNKQPSQSPQDLFVPLERQLDNVKLWNEWREWGLTEADFAAIDLTPTKRSGLVTDVIVPYLPDGFPGSFFCKYNNTKGVHRTFRELAWFACLSSPVGYFKWLEDHPGHLRLLDGIQHRSGLRRVTLDLAAHWNRETGTRLCDVRGPDSAHAEVLAAAAHFPKWVQAMDGKTVPCVWLPGYQVNVPGLRAKAWTAAPQLVWLDPLICLNISRDTKHAVLGGNLAAPVLLES